MGDTESKLYLTQYDNMADKTGGLALNVGTSGYVHALPPQYHSNYCTLLFTCFTWNSVGLRGGGGGSLAPPHLTVRH